jgi:hypothetical protein
VINFVEICSMCFGCLQYREMSKGVSKINAGYRTLTTGHQL